MKKIRLASELATLASLQVMFFLGILWIFRFTRILQTLLFEQILISVVLALIFSFYLGKFLARKFKFQFWFEGQIHFRYLLIIFAAITFLLSTSTILNIDRSRSFYVLSWVNKGEVSIQNNSINLLAVHSSEKYNSKGIVMRILEQRDRGIINKSGHKLKLSFKGKVTLFVANFLARTYSLNGWRENNY